MKKLALVLALAPLLATAQTPPPTTRSAAPMMQPEQAGPMDPARMEKMQRRMQLALTLGLAEALQLDDANALKVRGQIEKFSPRRMAAAQQMRDSVQVLRRSAKGDKTVTDVDGAITRLLDARAQMQVIDRELVTTITKDLPPEKRARAVLFLAKFHQRMMQELRPGGRGHRGPGGPGGPGMGPGMGPGPGQLGMNDADGDWDDGPGDSES